VNVQAAADELLLRQFGPTAVLVDERGDILYTNGRTGKYLEPSPGRANWNVIAMAREGLRHVLSGALHKATRHRRAVTVRDVSVGTNGATQLIDLVVKPIQEPNLLQGRCLVVFREVAEAPDAETRSASARRSSSTNPKQRSSGVRTSCAWRDARSRTSSRCS
jgi:hypothetical protein